MAKSENLVTNLFHRISIKERSFVARQLAVMLQSGLPITQAVRYMGNQTTNDRIKEILAEIVVDLENGYRFSEAIKKHPRLFNGIFIAVVAAGETSGKLDEVLNLLADEQEKDVGFRSKVVGALLYPGFIVVAMIVVGIIMVTRIIPALEGVFKESNVPLPFTTRAVIAVTHSLINFWYLYIFGIGLLIFVFVRYTATEDGRRTLSETTLRIPVIGVLVKNLEMARFTRIFAMLIQAGVPIIQALNSVGEVLDNAIYREALIDVASNVERGSPISKSLVKHPEFPGAVTQMIGVGEQTGKLEQVLNKLADYYERETDQEVKNVAALTEPVVFVIVGLGVAVLVFSIIVPIYNLAGAIK